MTPSDAQFKTVLRAIQKTPGPSGDVLAAPKITTYSGRQARVEVSEVRKVLTEDRPGTTAIPVGPSIDVIPNVLADRSIQMTLKPGITAFLGYDDPGPFHTPGADGVLVAIPLPRFSAIQTVTSVVIPEGHTLVMTGFGGTEAVDPAAKEPAAREPKHVVIFVTPTVVEGAGNRVTPSEFRPMSVRP